VTTELRDEDTLVYRFEADIDGSLWLARQLCERWLTERHVRSDAIDDLVLATAELCTAAALWPSTHIVLRGHIVGADVELVVETSGPQLVALSDDEIRPAGGDLRLAAALCDELVLRVRPERTVVIARKHGVVLPVLP
jgi:anti-sigma regulatory factor (Ser/Thr protein kinase)